MNKRRLIYLFVIVVVFLLYSNTTDSNRHKDQSQVSIKMILNDFSDLTDNDIPVANSEQQYYVTGIYFLPNFSGQGGEVFYVGWEDGDSKITQKYLITIPEKSENKHYVLKDTFENYLPPVNKFIYYQATEGKWQRAEPQDGSPQKIPIKFE